MAPTMSLPLEDTESPTIAAEPVEGAEAADPNKDPWFINMFKSREHEGGSSAWSNSAQESIDDDDTVPDGPAQNRNLETATPDSWYDTNLSASQRIDVED